MISSIVRCRCYSEGLLNSTACHLLRAFIKTIFSVMFMYSLCFVIYSYTLGRWWIDHNGMFSSTLR